MDKISHEINFKQSLFEEAKSKKIYLNEKCLCRLELYKDILLEWNKNVNLTSITDEREIIMKHFIDSLEIIKYIQKDNTIIDVGTGAGLPGLVIAIYFDGKVKVTLLDALNKRIAFLKYVVEKLELSNIDIIHGRAEELGKIEKYRERFDYCVSRAVAGLNILLEYDIPFIKVKGKALLLKGNNLNDEIKKSNKALEILNCKIINIYNYSYNVKNEKFERTIVEIQKNKSTPLSYPRNYNKIKKSPL